MVHLGWHMALAHTHTHIQDELTEKVLTKTMMTLYLLIIVRVRQGHVYYYENDIFF